MQKLKNIRLFLPIICIVVFSACSVQRQYDTTDMDLPDEFYLPDSVQENLDDAIIPWREFFKDTVLVRLISDAFEQNFDIRTANKEIAINEQYFKQSKLAFLPSFNLNLLNIERNWRSKYSRTGPENGYYDYKVKAPPENLYVSKSEFTNTAALDW